MLRTVLIVVLMASLVVAATPPAQSQSDPKNQTKAAAAQKNAAPASKSEAPAKSDADQAADAMGIAANVEAFAKAANAHDAKAIAATFTPTGEFVDGDGNVFHGRAAIEAEFDALFKANPKGRITITAVELRAIAPGVVVEEGTVTIGPAEADPTQAASATTVGYTIVHSKQSDSKWLMASVRSHGDEDMTAHEQLQQLGWLIGDWIDESDDSVVRTSTRWSDDKNFILSDFHVHVAGRRAMSGSTRIGWDASIGKFRSWVFDTEGGHASGLWTRVGDQWVVKVTAVGPDGEIGTMTNIYVPTGRDSIAFTSVDRIFGDETAPDVTVKIVRKPPEPKK
jgi:uncharacterized protein (TIGR02246 family)